MFNKNSYDRDVNTNKNHQVSNCTLLWQTSQWVYLVLILGTHSPLTVGIIIVGILHYWIKWLTFIGFGRYGFYYRRTGSYNKFYTIFHSQWFKLKNTYDVVNTTIIQICFIVH